MALDRQMFADKLNRFINQLQLTHDEVADKTGIVVKRISDLADGETTPTGDEVLILADLFKCDYAFFISNIRSSTFEEAEQFFRTNGKDLTKEDRINIQHFLYLCECQYFLLKEMGRTNFIQFDFIKRGNYYKGHGEQAANSLRKALGYSPHELPGDIYVDMRKLGIHIFRRRLSNQNISGLFIRHPEIGNCILVNYLDDVYRQRFTLIHEIAHCILDTENRQYISFTKYDSNDLSEIRADTFAASFLAPKEFIDKIPENSSWNSDKIIEFSNRMRLNPITLSIALKSMHLINDTQFDSFKELKIPKRRKIDSEISPELSQKYAQRKEELMQYGLSDSYVSLCLDAYYQSIISKGKLAEILMVENNELDAIFTLYGRIIDYEH